MDSLLKPPLPARGQAAGVPAAAWGARPLRVVWERAAELAVEVFRFSARPEALEPALRDPMRAAALAVPTCLARAQGRPGQLARQQLVLALGALAELESHLALAPRLGEPPAEVVQRLRGMLEVVRRLVLALGTRQPEVSAGVPAARRSP